MAVNPLIPGALLILFVVLWFVAGVVDGTWPNRVVARSGSAEPCQAPNRARVLARH